MSAVSDALTVPRPRTAAQEGLATRGMGLGQSVATALEALAANKLRSILTMLGIIIGVGAVIIMIALGRGASDNVAQRLQRLGTNLLNISPADHRGFGNVSAGAGSGVSLSEADAKAIGDNIVGLDGVSPSVDINVQAVSATSNWATRAQGVYPSYQTIENWQVQAGSLLSNADEQRGATSAVIGQGVLDNLFGNGNTGSGNAAGAVGQTIRLNKVPFPD